MKLIIEDDEGRKTVVPIVREEVEITIGRQEGNTIRLTERNVSRHHAKLTRRLGQVLIEDLNSYNGIKVNGDRINGAFEVKAGDLVQIGDYDLALEEDERPQAPTDAASAAAKTTLSHVPESADSPDGVTPTPPLRRPTPAQVARLRPASEDTPVNPRRNPDADGEEDQAEQDEPPAFRSPSPERRRSINGALASSAPGAHPDAEVEEIAAEDAPRLILTTSELAGREFACIRSELTIGRTNDNDIAIDHRSVSQNHCKLMREGDGWKVIDLHSVSGIKINGELYEESPLRFGDTLELGHLRFSFLAPGEEPTPAETELSPVEPPASNTLPILIGIGLIILSVLLVAIYFKMHRRPAEPVLASSTAVEMTPSVPSRPEPPAEETASPRAADPGPAKTAESFFDSAKPGDGKLAPAEPSRSGDRGAHLELTKPPLPKGRAEGARRPGPNARAAGASRETALRDFEQAESLKRLGKFKEAIPFFLSAIHSDPELDVAHFDLAVSLAKVGQYGEAAREFQYFANHFPDSPKAEIAQTNAREYSQRSRDLADSPKPEAPRESDGEQRPDM